MQFSRESIFLSSLRYFCNSLFAVFGILVALLIITVSSAVLMGPKLASKYKSEVILCPDHNGNDDLLPVTAPVIVKLNIDGIIGTPKLNGDTVDRILRESRKGMFDHNRVKAILIYMDSPGGTDIDSDSIYRQLVRYKNTYKIPITTYVNGLCASGGMYIACASDRIYSCSSAIIGSVGVRIGPFFNFKDLMTRYGINAETLIKGIDKDMMNPYRAWQEGEDASLKAIIDYSYRQFVKVVVSNRPNINETKLVNEYGAQVYDTVTAMEYGYIDQGDSDYYSSLKELAAKAGFAETEKYQVVEILVRPSWLTGFLDAKQSFFNGMTDKLLNPLGLEKPSNNRLLYYYDR
ncbi:MAG: S49 family peptidase [Chlamydiales bacterium]|nr:S49 family peptidase [Chlamydiales bacterium]